MSFLARSRSLTKKVQISTRCYSSSVVKPNLMKDVVNRYSISAQQHRIQLANNLFNAAQWQALAPEWYGPNKIKPDFRPQHAMLSMHIWFLHKRLLAPSAKKDEDSGKHGYDLMIQEELFDIFWNDTRSRIRSAGVHELTVNKHLKESQQATFLQCTQYDHAFKEFEKDDVKRFEVVCDAVWRHVLNGDEEADDHLIRRLGAYVEYQLDNIVYKLPDDYFDEGRIGWGNIPDFDFISQKKDADSTSGTEDPEHPEETTNALSGLKTLENGWMQVLTDAGEPYYWNTETNRTSWKSPEEIEKI